MTNIKFLLLGTSLSLIPTLTFAQCVATQDCATLGYTETSCNGGKGVKCPFGNKWACLPTKESICKEEGFTLACNETGQLGGGDSATPVVLAPLVAVSIPPAPAPLATNGKMAAVRKKRSLMDQMVKSINAMAKLLVYVLQVWASMSR